MVENIKIFDDFFPEDIHKKIWELMQRPQWSYVGGQPNSRFWHMEDLEDEDYFSEYLYQIILQNLGERFQKIITGCNRIYANGQTGGQCGNPHCDDGDITFLYYPNPIWKFDWQGHLMFMNRPYEKDKAYIASDNDEIIKTVAYKPNRAVIFDSKILHYGDAPHKFYNGLRVSLAYKFCVDNN